MNGGLHWSNFSPSSPWWRLRISPLYGDHSCFLHFSKRNSDPPTARAFSRGECQKWPRFLSWLDTRCCVRTKTRLCP